MSPSIVAAGLAADNVICAIYFTTLFALASNIAAETSDYKSGISILLLIFYFYKCFQTGNLKTVIYILSLKARWKLLTFK